MLKFKFLSTDIKLIDYVIALIFLSVSIVFLVSWTLKSDGEKLVLITTPKAVYEFPLNINRRLKIMGEKYEAIIEIKGKSVAFIESPCPRQICLQFGFIKTPGTSAVCIPNKIVVSVITKSKKNLVDTVCR